MNAKPDERDLEINALRQAYEDELHPLDFTVTLPEHKWWEAILAGRAAVEAEHTEFWAYMRTSRNLTDDVTLSVDWQTRRLTIKLADPKEAPNAVHA